MSTLVEVKNLKKYFKTPRGLLHAVDDINFKIEKGQTLGVVGESGCGKSTLFMIRTTSVNLALQFAMTSASRSSSA